MKYLFGEFQLNPATRELLRNGQPVALRPRSLECLVYLIEHRDRAVGRDELVAAVWGKVDIGDTVLAQTLLRARKALDDTGSQQGMIRTLPRFGYRWVAPVRELALPVDAQGDGLGDGERAVPSVAGDSGQGGPALPAIDLSAADGAADAAAQARIGPPATGDRRGRGCGYGRDRRPDRARGRGARRTATSARVAARRPGGTGGSAGNHYKYSHISHRVLIGLHISPLATATRPRWSSPQDAARSDLDSASGMPPYLPLREIG